MKPSQRALLFAGGTLASFAVLAFEGWWWGFAGGGWRQWVSPFPTIGTAIAHPRGVRTVTVYQLPLRGDAGGLIATDSGPFYFTYGQSLRRDPADDEQIVGTTNADGTPRETILRTKADLSGIAAGDDGAVWGVGDFQERDFSFDAPTALVRLTPARAVTVAVLPRRYGHARSMRLGPDGAFWYALPSAGAIGRTTKTGVSTLRIRLPFMDPESFAFDHRGNIYVAAADTTLIVRASLSGRVKASIRLAPGTEITGLAADPGGTIWFVDSQSQKIGHVARDGRVEEFVISNGAYPDDITNDIQPPFAVDRRNVWFSSERGRLERFSMATHVTQQIDIPEMHGSIGGIAVSKTGSVWVTLDEFEAHRCAYCGGIARVDP